VQHTLGSFELFSALNNFKTIFKIVQRLPFELKRQWSQKFEKVGQEASFAESHEFCEARSRGNENGICKITRSFKE